MAETSNNVLAYYFEIKRAWELISKKHYKLICVNIKTSKKILVMFV